MVGPSSGVEKSDRLALMLFYPEGLFGTLLARHREMGGGWEDGGRSEEREARRDKWGGDVEEG